ncbi:restriction endonuclease subunit S [uncultured Paraglaciecola sp.]|uniref:restriction endonuclease subunit S n=1 Tax=uncultured Paraglaciecola sp. TaxID=1765024 RepID=UPI0025999CE5|nr:restriction endonuclease subunit S [uncultured Paraglaciecola sp.]
MLEMETFQNFSFDKSDWQKVKFGDVIFEPKESVKDPVAEGIKHVVGLEHIDSEDIHLRRSASTEGSTTFTKRFSKGDVLFGRRRAYLKKAAIAKFNGICSGDITVMRAKPESILPSLLPFIINNNNFFEHAITHSAGGLSPRVKFKDLSNYEFLIPSKTEQRQLLELLHYADLNLQENYKLKESLEVTKKSWLKEAFKKDNCTKIKISDISESLDNRRVPIKKSERKDGAFPYYGASGVVDYVGAYIFDEPVLLISEDGENLNSRKLPIAYEVDEKCWVNNHAHVLKITKASRYLVAEYFNFHDVSDFITGGTRPKITKGMLSDMPIYLPKKDLSDQLENKLKSIDSSIEKVEIVIERNKELSNLLNRKVF